ncbi:hypothetical protein J6D24_02350 [Candidatus Saccharibacteria bacterium]|nr:hypothetical protein [Candidatus Saccharibacteria bacterium]
MSLITRIGSSQRDYKIHPSMTMLLDVSIVARKWKHVDLIRIVLLGEIIAYRGVMDARLGKIHIIIISQWVAKCVVGVAFFVRNYASATIADTSMTTPTGSKKERCLVITAQQA